MTGTRLPTDCRRRQTKGLPTPSGSWHSRQLAGLSQTQWASLPPRSSQQWECPRRDPGPLWRKIPKSGEADSLQNQMSIRGKASFKVERKPDVSPQKWISLFMKWMITTQFTCFKNLDFSIFAESEVTLQNPSQLKYFYLVFHKDSGRRNKWQEVCLS